MIVAAAAPRILSKEEDALVNKILKLGAVKLELLLLLFSII
jgi:hypothetical protein